MTTIDGSSIARPAPARSRWSGRLGRSAAPLIGLAVALAAFELLPRLGVIPRSSFPPASEILRRLAELVRTGDYWVTVGRTLRGWVDAMLIATILAIPAGMLIGATRVGYLLTKFTIDFLRPIPSVALIPLLVLIYGTQPRLKVVLAVIGAVFPLLFQAMYGIRDVDPVARQTLRSFGLSRLQQVRRLVWPTCLPFIMTGLRISSSIALILVVTGEYLVGIPGIGQATFLAQSSGAYATMYAWVVTAGVLGLTLNAAFEFTGRRVLFWHPSVRGEAR